MNESQSRELALLENEISGYGYNIVANGKSDGSTEVTLIHKVRGHKWSGKGSRHMTFPYVVALKMAYSRMKQFEAR